MKKQILTLAVLASVAIGGAVSQVSAGTYYTDDGSKITCGIGEVSCASVINGRDVWDHPGDAGQGLDPLDPGVYADEDFVSETN